MLAFLSFLMSMEFSVVGFSLYFEIYELVNDVRFFSFIVNPSSL